MIEINNRWTGEVIRTVDADTLRGANLYRANLSGANLSGADLSGANLPDSIPLIENLDAQILAAIERGGALEMDQWHTCETTHCRAGWAITIAGDAGAKLEADFGPSAAGALLYAKAYPDLPVPNFIDSNENALADMRMRAAL